MTEEKNNSVRHAAGLLLGLITAIAAAFLYKTESGKKVNQTLRKNYRHVKKHFDELIKDFSRPENIDKVDRVVKQEVKQIKEKINLIKKNVFSQSGKPLVK
ncbi:MAG: YtxH domain-containing protein [Patescibacteria group bacterium]|nr:YtxH domain-containing protein [Patescibacteria group bacterium]